MLDLIILSILLAFTSVVTSLVTNLSFHFPMDGILFICIGLSIYVMLGYQHSEYRTPQRQKVKNKPYRSKRKYASV